MDEKEADQTRETGERRLMGQGEKDLPWGKRVGGVAEPRHKCFRTLGKFRPGLISAWPCAPFESIVIRTGPDWRFNR